MTQPALKQIRFERPEGEALAHYERAVDLERRAAEAVMDWNLEQADKLREQAREAWLRYDGSTRQHTVSL